MKENSMPIQSARHPVNIGQLVMGIAFLGLVAVWALIQSEVVDGDDVRWLLPVPWVLAGLAGLLATTIAGRREWVTREPQPAVADTAAEPPADSSGAHAYVGEDATRELR
jgi:hypothetical protein